MPKDSATEPELLSAQSAEELRLSASAIRNRMQEIASFRGGDYATPFGPDRRVRVARVSPRQFEAWDSQTCERVAKELELARHASSLPLS